MEVACLSNPPGTGPGCHAPALVRLASGDLLAAWYVYPEDEYRGATIAIAGQAAGTAAWGRSHAPIRRSVYSAGNPVLFQDPSGVVRLLFVHLHGHYWNDAVLYECTSPDRGQSWTSPTQAWPTRGLMVRHPPVALQDGTLLLPAYEETSSQSLLLESRAPYGRWTVRHRFEAAGQIQPSLARLRDGSLVTLFRPTDDPRRVWRSFSLNDGSSWSPPIVTSLPTALSGLAAFGWQGGVAAVYNHTHRHERTPLSVALSHDLGVSWSAPRHLDSSPLEVSYPGFVSDGETSIVGAYCFNRRIIKVVSLDAGDLP